MREITRYEAVALNIHHIHPEHHSLILFDMEKGSVAYCNVQQNKPELVKLFQSEREDILNQTSRQLEESIPNFYEEISSLNQKMEQYYRVEKMIDSVVYQKDETSVTCSTLDAILQPVRDLIILLAEQAEKMAKEVLYGECAIVIYGKLALFDPISFFVREQLSTDPFLPDSRFIESIDVETVVEQGMNLYESESSFVNSHVCSLALLDAGGEKKVVELWKQGQDQNEIDDSSFVTGIYVRHGDVLHINIDGRDTKIALPFETKESGELVDVVIRKQEEKIVLVIRKSMDVEKMYLIPLVE